MLTLPPSVKIYVATAPIDMRRSFDALAGLARDAVGIDATTGHLFVFFGRHRDKVKILFWDRTGWCLYYKRLELGTFRLPVVPLGTTAIELASADLALILEGIDLGRSARRPRYRPRPTEASKPDVGRSDP